MKKLAAFLQGRTLHIRRWITQKYMIPNSLTEENHPGFTPTLTLNLTKPVSLPNKLSNLTQLQDYTAVKYYPNIILSSGNILWGTLLSMRWN